MISNVPNALEIMNRRFVDQPVQRGLQNKTFHKNRDCDLGGNEVIQLKLLKSESTKRQPQGLSHLPWY